MFLINSNNIQYFSLGRDAFENIFQNIYLAEDELVLIPSLICDVVLPPIRKYTNNIRYYSLNKNLEPKNLFDFENVRVIILVNYFGFPQNINQIIDYYKNNNNIIIIEDNAHGFLSKDESNNYLGTRGDYGIFSYRKTFFLPDGAILFKKNISVNDPLICKENTKLKFRIKHIFLKISKILNTNILLIIRKIKLKNYISFSDENFMKPELPFRYSINFILNIDADSEINRRRNLYKYFNEILKPYNISPVFDNLPKNTCPYGYAFYVNDENDLKKIIKISNKFGFDCVFWPQLPRDTNIFYINGNIGKIFFINFTYQ